LEHCSCGEARGWWSLDDGLIRLIEPIIFYGGLYGILNYSLWDYNEVVITMDYVLYIWDYMGLYWVSMEI
jgi:hypothetical protein